MPLSSDWNWSWCGQGPREPAAASHSSEAPKSWDAIVDPSNPHEKTYCRLTDRRMRPDVEVGPAWYRSPEPDAARSSAAAAMSRYQTIASFAGSRTTM